MKVTDKLRKKLDGGVTITNGRQFSYYRTESGKWYMDAKLTEGEVVHISKHEVPTWVLLEYQQFKKTKDMKKRFKTKSELAEMFKPEIIAKLEIQYGEPADKGESTHLTTTNPHPYEGIDFVIKTYGQPDVVLSQVQQKLFTLGHCWAGGSTEERKTGIWPSDLIVGNVEIFHNPSPEDYEDNIVLTPQQFMEGEVPKEEVVNPYEGKAFKIKVTPQNTEMVQAKAYALGYCAVGATDKIRPGVTSVYLSKEGKVTWMSHKSERSDTFFCNHKNTELTPEEFMSGCLPLDDVTEYIKMTEHYAGVDPCKETGWLKREGWTLDSLEVTEQNDPSRPDAYIDKYHQLWVQISDAGDPMPVAPVNESWKYNLMSEEAFKAKYPDKLKFKEWEVTPGTRVVKIGCETFYKKDLGGFSKVMQFLNTHKVDAKEFCTFLYCNKEKLGLDF